MAARSLLYVEDDDAAFFLMKIALGEADSQIQLFRAADGEQALRFLQHSGPFQNAPRPDLIVLDVNLPKRNGLEVLKALKESESLCAIPVIMFTTSAGTSDRETSLALGAEEYVTKPRTLERFMEIVKAFSRFSEDASDENAKGAS